MSAATGYLGFKLASGETLLLPQGATFDLVRPVEDFGHGNTTGMRLPQTITTVVPGVVNLAERVARKPAKPARAGSRPDADALDRNRKAVEAHGLTAAAKELGVNYATLYGQATRLGWKIPKVARAKAPTGKALEKAAAKAATGALRRCERCEQMTRSNPCQHCGTAWNRAK